MMAHIRGVAFRCVLVAGVIVVFSQCGWLFQADAQDATKESIAKVRPKAEKFDPSTFGVTADRPYPSFSVDDVVTRLATSTEQLIEKKLSKGAVELRKNLDRSTFAMKLAPENSNAVSSQELYLKSIESVFLVAGMTKPAQDETDWKTSFSTAFVVHEDGILSTSAHVFDHDDQDDGVVVLDVHGKVHPIVEILATNRKADTVLFRIGTRGLRPLPLGKDALPGTSVRVIGHPGDSFFFFSAGHLANYERDDQGMSWLNITADFGQGASGAPVMDECGNVIGQVSRTYTLYAGGDASNRRQRRRKTRALNGTDSKEHEKLQADDETADDLKKSDPQMVFKACTPVSAIRSLVK